MTYVNTGLEIANRIMIDKLSGENHLPGYPKYYSILSAFTAGGNSYGVLTQTQLQQLPNSEYLARLADFKIYVQQAEGIASVDAITESGYAAYRTNTTSCPIGQ